MISESLDAQQMSDAIGLTEDRGTPAGVWEASSYGTGADGVHHVGPGFALSASTVALVACLGANLDVDQPICALIPRCGCCSKPSWRFPTMAT